MVDVAPGLITNGLGGNCTNVMLGFFHLGFLEVVIPGSPPVGSPPLPPGSPPIPPVEKPTLRPGGTGGPIRRIEDYPEDEKIQVIVRVRVREIWHERTYWVLPKSARFIIKIVNLMNTTILRVTAKVSNVQNRIKSAVAKISNITKKGDKE